MSNNSHINSSSVAVVAQNNDDDHFPSPIRKLDLTASSTLTSQNETTSLLPSSKENNANQNYTTSNNDDDEIEKSDQHQDESSSNNNMICSFFSNACSCSCECECSCCCSSSSSNKNQSISQFELARKHFVSFYIPNLGTGIGTALFATLIPVSMRDFGESDSLTGLVISLAGLGRVIADVPSTLLSHKIGPLWTMIIAVLIAAIVTSLPVIEYHVWAFIVTQAIVGLPLGAFAVPRLELLQFCLPTSERNIINSHMGAGARFSFLVGPVVGGFVYHDVGARWGYLCGCGFILIALVALLCSRDLSDMSRKMMEETHKILKAAAKQQHEQQQQSGSRDGSRILSRPSALNFRGEHVISYSVIEAERRKEKEKEEKRKKKLQEKKQLLSQSGSPNQSLLLSPKTKSTSFMNFGGKKKDECTNSSSTQGDHQNDDAGGGAPSASAAAPIISVDYSSTSSSSSDKKSMGTDTENQSLTSHPDRDREIDCNNDDNDEEEEGEDFDENEKQQLILIDEHQQQQKQNNDDDDDHHHHHHSSSNNTTSRRSPQHSSSTRSSSQVNTGRLSLIHSSRKNSARNHHNQTNSSSQNHSPLRSPLVPPISLPGSPTMTSTKLASLSSPFLAIPRHPHQLSSSSAYHNQQEKDNEEDNNISNNKNREKEINNYTVDQAENLEKTNTNGSLVSMPTHHAINNSATNENLSADASTAVLLAGGETQPPLEGGGEVVAVGENNDDDNHHHNHKKQSGGSVFMESLKTHWANVICIGVMALSTTALRQGRRLALTFRALNLDYTAKEVGFVMALSFSIDTIFFWISPHITNKFGYRAAVVPLQVIYAMAFVILSFDSSETDNATLLIACVVFGIGDIMGAGLMLSIISEMVPRPLVGFARSFVDLGVMLGPIVTGVMSHQIGLSWCCRILAMWSVFATIWAIIVLPANVGRELEKWMKMRKTVGNGR